MPKQLHNKLIKNQTENYKRFLKRFSDAIINGEASIFLGTGISMNSNLPSWITLLEPCFTELNIPKSANISLYKIAQYYANLDNSDSRLRKLVNDQINQYYKSNDVLKNLLSINFKSIWTTNYDRLIENELSSNNIAFNSIINESNLTQISTHDKINVYKINGDFSEPNTMVLTQSDYENYELTHSLFLTFLKKELVSNSFLFLGYSFEDQVVLNCLSSTKRLLEGAGNLHYALLFIDDNVTAETEYKVQDLRLRYNIECIYVDANSILNTIKDLNYAVKKKKVFISGAYNNVPQEIDKFADDLSKSLTIKLLKSGNRISTGIGRKLGTYITGYANQFLAENHIGNPQNFLSMRPFPFHETLTEEQKETYRIYMQHDCSWAIFLFGQSNQTIENINKSGVTHYCQGVYQEYLIAKKLGLKIIPVGSTGYESKLICDEVKQEINRYPYLSKKIDILMNEKNPNKLSELITSIINQDSV